MWVKINSINGSQQPVEEEYSVEMLEMLAPTKGYCKIIDGVEMMIVTIKTQNFQREWLPSDNDVGATWECQDFETGMSGKLAMTAEIEMAYRHGESLVTLCNGGNERTEFDFDRGVMITTLTKGLRRVLTNSQSSALVQGLVQVPQAPVQVPQVPQAPQAPVQVPQAPVQVPQATVQVQHMADNKKWKYGDGEPVFFSDKNSEILTKKFEAGKDGAIIQGEGITNSIIFSVSFKKKIMVDPLNNKSVKIYGPEGMLPPDAPILEKSLWSYQQNDEKWLDFPIETSKLIEEHSKNNKCKEAPLILVTDKTGAEKDKIATFILGEMIFTMDNVEYKLRRCDNDLAPKPEEKIWLWSFSAAATGHKYVPFTEEISSIMEQCIKKSIKSAWVIISPVTDHAVSIPLEGIDISKEDQAIQFDYQHGGGKKILVRRCIVSAYPEMQISKESELELEGRLFKVLDELSNPAQADTASNSALTWQYNEKGEWHDYRQNTSKLLDHAHSKNQEYCTIGMETKDMGLYGYAAVTSVNLRTEVELIGVEASRSVRKKPN